MEPVAAAAKDAALLSGQDPQAHARSAWLTPHSRWHSTSRLRQPLCLYTRATTWEPHQPHRNQSVLVGPIWGLHSPVRALVPAEMEGHTGPRGWTVIKQEPLALFAVCWVTGSTLCSLFLFQLLSVHVFFFSCNRVDLCGSSPLRQNEICLMIGGRVQYTSTAQESHT